MSKGPNKDAETPTPAEESFGAAAYERPVPRIAIECFSEFPDTIATFQRAAADRRLCALGVLIAMPLGAS